MSKPTAILQGTLDLLILKILNLEPRTGWAISQRIQQISRDFFQVPQGSLYPALHRLPGSSRDHAGDQHRPGNRAV